MKFLPEADDEERAALLAGARDLLGGGARAGVLRKLPPLERVKWHLAAEGRAGELVGVVRFERENPAAFHVRGLRRARIELPCLDTGSLPEEVTRLRAGELPVRAKLTGMTWEDGKLVVRGYAYLVNVPAATRSRVPRLAWLRRRGSKRRVPLGLRTVRDPRATADSKQALHCYDWSGFEIAVDPAKFRTGGGWSPGEWVLTVAVPGPGGAHRGGVLKTQIGTSGHSQVRFPEDGVRLVAGFDEDRLRFTVDRVPAEVTGHARADDDLELAVRVRDAVWAASGPVRLRVVRAGSDEPVDYELVDREPSDRSAEKADDGWRHCAARVPVPELYVAATETEKTADFHASFLFDDGSTRRATVGADFAAGCHLLPGGREIAVTTDGPGLLKLHDRMRQPVLDRLEWTDEGELLLEGAYSGPAENTDLILRHGERFEERALPLTFADGRFTARVRPEETESYGERLPLRKGRWYFSFRARGARSHKTDAPVKIRADLVDRLPLEHTGTHRTYTLERRFFDRVFLASGPVLTDGERGAYRQRLLREDFTAECKTRPLRDAVFYNSFGGKQFSDSPRAVYEELMRRGLDVEHLWSVSDQQVALPPGARPVEWHSAEWYEALARSRYVVTNVGIGDWFERREGQRVVQTWHGTPLKKIGADLLGTPKANRAYIASLPHRSRQWDFLVSPNAFTTPIMRNAFCCETEILESGYPRNDIFHAPDRDKTAARVRETLGIPSGRKVVLYAPTWRDDQRYGGQRFKLDLHVDLAAAERALGADHVFLFRKHPKVLDSIPGAGQGFVWDVSAYPDIAELYLIADVLITDYSSAFFDFAHSGRPMLFFTYDLEHYRDTLRGFYFDFAARAPGPLVKTSEELVRALRELDTVRAEYGDRYAEFVRDFCEPADGLATRRVVDRMLEVDR
ncbi:CDP-glycerol glycerophosphotransferase family protein [Streptomyces armeniacus]|uniref:CDP-glycerol glycerophosphotransferase family protein n=1 Tax=Streptomyces armeniacus TaxID=83291 RepID=A0A345XZZ6_9ACTN|nr:CDP-glycerol glycerophosphotransferase family protein [Streptomyces armeniacus]AXK37212.1 CDP-glycerol glycerophosphotransferase family protein [Streptomyces armeniacus]